MANVCVIIGGDHPIGLETARCMPKDKIVLLAGMNREILDAGIKGLEYTGYTVYGRVCNPMDRASVQRLAEFANQLGEVKCVVNCAEKILPITGTAEEILRAHTLKSVYVNEEFAKVMQEGAIVDLSSHYGYAIPAALIPKRAFSSIKKDEDLLIKKLTQRCMLFQKEEKQKRVAYMLSQSFVHWYTKNCAFAYGEKGLRFLVLSIGAVETDKEGQPFVEDYLPFSVEGRKATPEEIGYTLSTLADERNGYLTGVEIVCDGGAITGKKGFKKKKGNN